MGNPMQAQYSTCGLMAYFYQPNISTRTNSLTPTPKIKQQAPKYVLPSSPEYKLRMELIDALDARVFDNSVPHIRPKNEHALLRAYNNLLHKRLNAQIHNKPLKISWFENVAGILKKLSKIK